MPPVLPHSFLLGTLAGACGYFSCILVSRLLLAHVCSRSQRDRVAALSEKERRLDFHSRLPSTVHAVVQVLATGPTVLTDTPWGLDRVNHFDERIWSGGWKLGPAVFAGVFVGYLMSDFLWCGQYDTALMVGHHLVAAAAWTVTSSLRTLQYYQQFLQFNELSTIFINVRALLLVSGCGENVLVMLVSVAVLLTFGAVRVLPLPMLFFRFVNTDAAALLQAQGWCTVLATTGLLCFHAVMQSFWYAGMLRMTWDKLCGKESKPRRSLD